MSQLSALKTGLVTGLTCSLAFAALTFTSTSAFAQQEDRTNYKASWQHTLAPHSLTGKDMVLSVQSLEAAQPELYASQGVIIQQYTDSHRFSQYGVGDDKHQDGQGHYRFHRTGIATAIVKTFDEVTGNNFVTRYRFESENFGRFQRESRDGLVKISGQFSLADSQLNASEHLAEASHDGLTVAVNITDGESTVVPKGYYPDRALVLQSYNADGTYSASGFGPAAIPHSGTYTYTKVSANVAVEQTIQVTDNFTLPFTMVYFYHTPTSGTWYQDFGHGTIKFSGVFSTYVTTQP